MGPRMFHRSSSELRVVSFHSNGAGLDLAFEYCYLVSTLSRRRKHTKTLFKAQAGACSVHRAFKLHVKPIYNVYVRTFFLDVKSPMF